jgi:hypothetical protein
MGDELLRVVPRFAVGTLPWPSHGEGIVIPLSELRARDEQQRRPVAELLSAY